MDGLRRGLESVFAEGEGAEPLERNLLLLASCGAATIMRRLLSREKRVDAEFLSQALFLSSCNGHADAVRALLDAKADVNSQDQKRADCPHMGHYGGSPIHCRVAA
uniref:Uncharacterized protein n=1 Tax=Chromera velia CCMP2878 TaxID=1169474 RepID=A0A0G4HNW7_9ALVE|eukprot:Cvel_7691.t1-p1 / transcript=Cvel_7691.t1 / gene=Cvel_7691 / organism=Chromera_velia_CCMP2878 / gene_product=hypothetical protein / transcript_product=hypothetical protein / location=Cvel_scaffold408:37156-37752(+) / protein_length=105 / sequence_SO=supercontig / SO=protein_coding / is_pseudo=false